MKNHKITRPPYEVLRVSTNADYRTVRRRYKTLIREYTPEHHPEKFNEISVAYQSIIGGREIDTTQFPLYATPVNVVRAKIEQQKSATTNDDSSLLDLLSVIPESIFNVEFELEQIIKTKI